MSRRRECEDRVGCLTVAGVAGAGTHALCVARFEGAIHALRRGSQQPGARQIGKGQGANLPRVQTLFFGLTLGQSRVCDSRMAKWRGRTHFTWGLRLAVVTQCGRGSMLRGMN